MIDIGNKLFVNDVSIPGKTMSPCPCCDGTGELNEFDEDYWDVSRAQKAELRVDVFLNDKPVEKVRACHLKEGWLVRAKTENGKLVLQDEKICEVVETGTIRLEFSDR